MKKHLPFLLSLALLGATAFLVRPLLRAAATPDSDRVNELLAESKSLAHQISADAHLLESYTRSQANWESHKSAVDQMKQHINDAGQTLARLDEARDTASPWQSIAIERIRPLLKEIAANTEAAILFLNKHPTQLRHPEYRDYVSTTAEASTKLAGLVSDFVDYGHTKGKLERLTLKLELPAGTEP